MKNLNLILVLFLALCIPAVAQEAKVKKPAVTNTSTETVTGRITYLNDKKICVRPKGAEASTAFLFAADTKFTINDEPKTLADIKKDWKATVTPKAGELSVAESVACTKTVTSEKKAEPEATP